MNVTTPIWKVIIADDEPIIREGIRDAVDWPSIGMTVEAEAEDGAEALELALLHQAHVMLVDLNMPIMSGLALIREVRAHLPDCRIVIITGHDEFGYAQQAISYGVDEYILKPANPRQLNEVLGRIGASLGQHYHQEMHLEQASRQIRRNIPLLRERFCKRMDRRMRQSGHGLRFPQPRLPLHRDLALAGSRSGAIRTFRARQAIDALRDREYCGLICPLSARAVPGTSWFYLRHSMDDGDGAIFSDIEQAVNHYLKLNVVSHSDVIESGLEGVGGAFRRARGGVYKETSISPLIRRARQYMREHYGNPELSLEETAAAAGVSSVYLSRMFKQESARLS